MYTRLLSPMYTNICCKNLPFRKAADVIFSTASRGWRIISALVKFSGNRRIYRTASKKVKLQRYFCYISEFHISFPTPKMVVITSSDIFLLHVYNCS